MEGVVVSSVVMSSSSSPSRIDVALDRTSSYSPKYGRKSGMLNVGLTPNSGGNSSLYALSLIFLRILKEPSTRDISLDFLKSGNHFFLKCNQTKSPSSNFTSFQPLLPAIRYFSFIFSMFNLVVSCILRINSYC
jgi:hypothetical protein